MNKVLPAIHGFNEFFGYLYQLDAMSDPFRFDYPQDWIELSSSFVGRPSSLEIGHWFIALLVVELNCYWPYRDGIHRVRSTKVRVPFNRILHLGSHAGPKRINFRLAPFRLAWVVPIAVAG